MTAFADRRLTRLPVLFVPHGGGPWPFVDLGFPRHEVETLADALRGIPHLARVDVQALLVISAHWEEPEVTLMTSPSPPMLYDYYGFPDEAYAIQWPAPGAPELAQKVEQLLKAAGVPWKEDAQRGYDHGTFVPLKLAYPRADVPVLQISLRADFDPRFHIELGRILALLREQGVLIIGTGMSFHNLRALRQSNGKAMAVEFDQWLKQTMHLSTDQRLDRLANWEQAPHARFAHPREEHLLPLMVIAGAAGEDRATPFYEGTIMGWPHAGFSFGVSN